MAAATLAAVLLWGAPAVAQLGLSCTIEASPVAFGTYDVFAASPSDSTGTVTVRCTLGVGLSIALSAGASGTYSPRRLQGSTATLAYNLYTDAARTSVWGNGSGATSTVFHLLQALTPVVTTVHARVPAGQDVRPGAYSDTVVATFSF